MDYQHKELTEKIIGAFYDVYNGLGYGFLEKVYENAFAIELKHNGHKVEQQMRIQVRYRGEVIGDYYADLIVDDTVIVELKASSKLLPQYEAQLLNYLKATPYEVGLLFNFGPMPTVKRKAFGNHNKPNLQQE